MWNEMQRRRSSDNNMRQNVKSNITQMGIETEWNSWQKKSNANYTLEMFVCEVSSLGGLLLQSQEDWVMSRLGLESLVMFLQVLWFIWPRVELEKE